MLNYADTATETYAVSCSLLEKIQPRVVSYEEQVTTVREHLANLLEKEEEWSKAAQTLAGIDLDSGARECKCTLWNKPKCRSVCTFT